jgi:hypothetical protein
MAEESSDARREGHRAACARYRAKMTEEDKERRRMTSCRRYYLQKGVVPHEYTSLGRYCKERGYSVEAVMSGEQPL